MASVYRERAQAHDPPRGTQYSNLCLKKQKWNTFFLWQGPIFSPKKTNLLLHGKVLCHWHRKKWNSLWTSFFFHTLTMGEHKIHCPICSIEYSQHTNTTGLCTLPLPLSRHKSSLLDSVTQPLSYRYRTTLASCAPVNARVCNDPNVTLGSNDCRNLSRLVTRDSNHSQLCNAYIKWYQISRVS